MNRRILIVGIGSDHGDDQAGLLVAQALADHAWPECEIRAARSPSDLLGWLVDRERLVLCDACRGGGAAGSIRHWTWPAGELLQCRWSGTHDLSLPGVLALARELDWLPPRVDIWGIESNGSTQDSQLSSSVERAVNRVAHEILTELSGDVGERRAAANCTNAPPTENPCRA